MKALPHCDVPRAICTTEGKDVNKEGFACFCKPGFTGANSNCMGEGSALRSIVEQTKNWLGTFKFWDHLHLFVFQILMNVSMQMLIKCSKDALCINTAGTYECRCKDGFIGDGLICSGTY